jgi:hypothetical protein
MSHYTRLASTDDQEASIAAVERAFKKANTNIGGATTIGKSPQTVIMDIYHNDSKIYINYAGDIQINNEPYHVPQIKEMADAIMAIRDRGPSR